MKTNSSLSTESQTRTIIRPSSVLMIVGMMLAVSGCSVIGDIFKAGVWVGIIFVVVIIAIIVGVMRMFSK